MSSFQIRFAENVSLLNQNSILKVICVAYDRKIPLGILIDSFILQTCPRWELNIIYDGCPPTWYTRYIKKYEKDKRVRFYNSNVRYSNFGHPNRRAMLEMIKGTQDDFVLMTNDDNYYVPRFVEMMMDRCLKDVGFVYCDTVHSHFDYRLNMSEVKVGRIDMGAFIVRFDIAKRVGFFSDEFSADGIYAEACKNECDKNGLKVSYIQKPLFIHN